MDLELLELMGFVEFVDEPDKIYPNIWIIFFETNYFLFLMIFLLLSNLLGLEDFLVQPANFFEQTKLINSDSLLLLHKMMRAKVNHTILTCSGAQRTLATKTKPMSKIAAVNPLVNILHNSSVYYHLSFGKC